MPVSVSALARSRSSIVLLLLACVDASLDVRPRSNPTGGALRTHPESVFKRSQVQGGSRIIAHSSAVRDDVWAAHSRAVRDDGRAAHLRAVRDDGRAAHSRAVRMTVGLRTRARSRMTMPRHSGGALHAHPESTFKPSCVQSPHAGEMTLAAVRADQHDVVEPDRLEALQALAGLIGRAFEIDLATV
jgi:hypothetical protein